jgi:hypothetical protein
MKFDHHDFDDDFGDYGSDDDDMDPRSRHRMDLGGGFRGMRKRPPPDPRLEDKPRGGWTGKPVSW